MSRNRFKELVRCMRFGDMYTRAARKDGEQGKIALIHELWEKFIKACQKNYTASPYVTIDESLLAFRGKCSFKVCITSKPGKYGIKVWSMVDVSNAYLMNAQIYKGKLSDGPERHQTKRVVKDLTTSIINFGKNVTSENFFTDFSLAIELFEKNLTILGTLRKNKRKIPPLLQRSRKRKLFSTEFDFSKDYPLTMCRYVPQVNKAVLLLSSMHYDNKIQENESFKPDMILDYNETKSDVDTLDQLVNNYACKRVTNRWPMILFYWMLDVVAYNSAAGFMAKAPDIYKVHQKHRHFLSALSEQLCKGKIERRFLTETKYKAKHVITCMEAFVNVEKVAGPSQNQNNGNQKKRCKKCPRKLGKKTKKSCIICSEPICDSHNKFICIECFNDQKISYIC